MPPLPAEAAVDCFDAIMSATTTAPASKKWLPARQFGILPQSAVFRLRKLFCQTVMLLT